MFDLETQEKILSVADECKCRLTSTYLEEAINADDLIEDIRKTWDIIKSNVDADMVRIWSYCYLTEDEDIKVKFKDGKIVSYFMDGDKLSTEELEEALDDNFDVAYSYHEMSSQLDDNHVFDVEEGNIKVKFAEEKDHCKKLLKKHGYQFDVTKDANGTYNIDYWKDSEKMIREAFGTQKFDIELVDKASGETQKAVIRGKDQEDAIARFFKKPWNVECEITSIVPHEQKKAAVAASKPVEDKDPVNV